MGIPTRKGNYTRPITSILTPDSDVDPLPALVRFTVTTIVKLIGANVGRRSWCVPRDLARREITSPVGSQNTVGIAIRSTESSITILTVKGLLWPIGCIGRPRNPQHRSRVLPEVAIEVLHPVRFDFQVSRTRIRTSCVADQQRRSYRLQIEQTQRPK